MSLTVLLLSALLGPLLYWGLAAAGNRLNSVVALALPVGLFAGFLSLWPTVSGGDTVHELISWAPSLGVTLDLRLDGFSLLFALLITGIGSLVTVYSAAVFADTPLKTRSRFLLLL